MLSWVAELSVSLNKPFCLPGFGLQNRLRALNTSPFPPRPLQKENGALKELQRLQMAWFDGGLFMLCLLLVQQLGAKQPGTAQDRATPCWGRQHEGQGSKFWGREGGTSEAQASCISGFLPIFHLLRNAPRVPESTIRSAANTTNFTRISPKRLLQHHGASL